MLERLRKALARIDGVVESESYFTDAPAFWGNGKEIAHFEGESVVDIRLTRKEIRDRRTQLRADPRVRLRPSSSADWLAVEVCEPADETFVIELVRAAAEAHRAPPGTTAAPPPTGTYLARRRQFH
ncbi:MAG TPA: luciferase family protein [Micromonosporaceae bacterium]|nr:luciferase family protein [Micromonosporaceae bacterium]